MQDFYQGQLIECIDDKPRARGDMLGPLRANTVYTVRWHGYVGVGRFPTAYKVRLEEIYRHKRPFVHAPMEDMPYLASRFRPLDNRPTDIADLKKLLDSASEPVSTVIVGKPTELVP